MKKLFKALLVLLIAAMLVACGNNKANDKKPAEGEKPAEEKAVKITFWHAMNDKQEEVLTKLTKDFMAENKNITVELMNQGQYKDLSSKISATLVSPKDLPTITQAYPGWVYNAAKENLLVDISGKMDQIDKKDDIVPALLDGAKIDGKQYGIPFNKSTEVLFYNADILKQYGVEVPKTYEELAAASKTIFEKSNGKVVGAGFDSLNNYYVIGLQEEKVNFDNKLDILSEQSIKVLDYYQKGIKEGYFRIAGEDKYLSTPFGNQVVAMTIGSTAGESFVAKGAKDKFTYEVAVRPSKANLQQGTDLYMFSSASEDQQNAAMKYMNFLVSEKAQLEWSIATGYLPVRQSVLASDAYKNSTSKVAKIAADATKDLFAMPVVENGDAAYNLTREFTEKILSDKNLDIKKALSDTYVQQLKQTWEQ